MATPKSMLFLGLCCIAAIAAVGSVFELTSGEPELGSTVTTIILAVSLPMAALSFFGAVKSADTDDLA